MEVPMDCNAREERALRLARAVKLVLAGDVNAYEEIYAVCDGALRAFVGRRYGHLGDDFVNEVAIRTHEFAFTHLDSYNSDGDATYQTWLNLRSLNVAGEVLAERLDLHRLGPRGARRRVGVSESFDEETHALRPGSGHCPAEEYEAKMRSRLLWQEYEALAREGRLSIALHDVEGRTLAETAQALDMPLIRVRRLLDRNHNRLRKRLKRRGVRPAECEPHYGRVWSQPDDTGYDDDWTATSMAYLPDDPDSLVGAAAKSEEEDEETP
jgi:DNA-directed RNA polymerase specialized sigma24 family protein